MISRHNFSKKKTFQFSSFATRNVSSQILFETNVKLGRQFCKSTKGARHYEQRVNEKNVKLNIKFWSSLY